MGSKMIAICSAAIGLVYATGYFVTASGAVEDAASPAPTTATTAAPATTATAAPKGSQTGTATQSKAPAKTSKYKDGTYTGRGSNRIGSVQVAVTVQNDKIVSVKITDCTTHYPQAYIDGLPDQVLGRQSAVVDYVSGATKSTDDFRIAVQQALAQASAALGT
jgi:uncharacterized protein with FMN-binding domain